MQKIDELIKYKKGDPYYNEEQSIHDYRQRIDQKTDKIHDPGQRIRQNS